MHALKTVFALGFAIASLGAFAGQPIQSPLDGNTGIGRPTGRYGPVTPVPEPSQWAMMLAGLALVGFIVRRNSKRS